MLDVRGDFSDFGGRVWLNCAHQGPLPLAAAEAAHEAVAWKTTPHALTTERFTGVPARLRRALGRLIGVPPDEIILANGASYGLHLLANGLPLAAGDEVLVMRGDFPSCILPWLGLEARGVRVRQVEPAGAVLTPDEVEAHLTPATRVVCLTWVHSLSGHAIDLEGVGARCRAHGAWFVANTTQGLGARPLDASKAPLDALVNVGWKWLVGPYGTGFCWIRPALRARLRYNRAYWLSMQTADDLGRTDADVRLPDDPEALGARRYDVFGTANFFNYVPWTASVEYVLRLGPERIRDHDQRLVQRLLDGLDRTRYRVLSPAAGPSRSTLVFVSHHDAARNADLHAHLQAHGVDVAFRRGCLRVSPHFYNTEADIEGLLAALAS